MIDDKSKVKSFNEKDVTSGSNGSNLISKAFTSICANT